MKNTDNFLGVKKALGLTTRTVEASLERDVVSLLPRRVKISAEWSLGSGGRRRPDVGVLCQPFHERAPNQMPKAREADASSLHHLGEA